MSIERNLDSDRPARWLAETLEVYQRVQCADPAANESPSETFQSRCAEAAVLGRSLAALRGAATVVSDPSLGIVEYLRRISEPSTSTLERIVKSAGLSGNPTTHAFAAAWGRLARWIGLSLADARGLLRWTYIGAVQPDLLPVPVAFRATGGRLPAATEDHESPVLEALAGLSADELESLAHCVATFERSYDASFHSN